ncbi:MAG: enoyl-CoA hydratase-related protein, partial [Curvibacter sp.]
LVLREAGAATAREMLLEAAVLGAAQMQSRGFVQRVVPEAALASEIEQSVQRIARLAPQDARFNKQTLRALQPMGAGMPAALMDSAYDYADSAEHREGIASFLAKRPADFSFSLS